jgi:hypothetical protein
VGCLATTAGLPDFRRPAAPWLERLQRGRGRSDAWGVANNSHGPSALAQEVNELLPLISGEFEVTTARMGFGLEPSLGVLDTGITPASDGTGRCFDVSGHLGEHPHPSLAERRPPYLGFRVGSPCL